MELEQVKKEFNKFARQHCLLVGYEPDETADLVMHDFLDRRYSNAKFMFFMYENL